LNFIHIVVDDYFNVIMNSIKVENFIKRLITLIFKIRDEEELGNWCLIFLLKCNIYSFCKSATTTFTIFTINSNQNIFLFPICILNNVFLTHETTDWARHSKQDMILLKLDFVNAYNKVFWNFMNHE